MIWLCGGDERPDLIALLIKAMLEDGDPALVASAIGDVARAKGMAQVDDSTRSEPFGRLRRSFKGPAKSVRWDAQFTPPRPTRGLGRHLACRMGYPIWILSCERGNDVALYVKDAQVDALAEQLMAITRASKTEAVRRALQNEIRRERAKLDLVQRSIDFAQRLRERAGPRAGQTVDKAFLDGLYEAE